MWWIEINESVPLNSTKLITLEDTDAEGLGQLNLNYVDSAGSHQKAIGELFHINHDTTQPSAVTYNQNAIHTTSIPPAATPTSSPSSPNLSASTENILTSSTVARQPWTSPAPNNMTSSTIRRGDIASIVLGVILGITVATVLVLYRILRRRRQRASLEASTSVLLSAPGSPPTYELCEADAATPPNEVPSKHDRPELPGFKR